MQFLSQIMADLRVEKTRIILTIFAVAIGTAAIMVMLAVGTGMRSSLGESMSSAGSGILVIKPGYAEKSYGGYPSGRDLNFTQKDVLALERELHDIAAVAGEYSLEAILQTADRYNMFQVSGVNRLYGELRNITPAVGGRFFNPLDMQEMRRVIFIGNNTAEVLFPDNKNPIGEQILVQGHAFTVIGILPNRMRIGGASSRSDNLGAWIPDSTFAAIFGGDKVNSVVIQPYSSELMPVVKQRVQQLIARLHAADPSDKNIVQEFDAQVIQEQTDTFLFGMVVFLGIIGTLTLAVAGVGIANVMYLTVRNATREIGLRMALGARQVNILIHYLLQALLATATGGLLGLLCGYGLVQLAGWALIHYTANNRYMGEIQPLISFSVMAVVILVLVIVGLCAGLFPARQAASIAPAEALRDE